MKPRLEIQTVEELKIYLKDRVTYFLEEMMKENNGFEIENKAYAIRQVADHVYQKMWEANNFASIR